MECTAQCPEVNHNMDTYIAEDWNQNRGWNTGQTQNWDMEMSPWKPRDETYQLTPMINHQRDWLFLGTIEWCCNTELNIAGLCHQVLNLLLGLTGYAKSCSMNVYLANALALGHLHCWSQTLSTANSICFPLS